MDPFEEWVKSTPQYPCLQKWADRLIELGASWDSFRRDRNEVVNDLIEGGIPLLAARDIVGIASEAVKRSCSPMAVFWDLENMPIPTASSGRDVTSRLKTILAPHGDLIQFRGYASIGLGLIPQSKRSDLQLSGCHLVDCPHSGRKEVADKMIIVDAMQFAFMHPKGATLCFVTGDVDYAYLLAVLQRPQWRTIVISKGTIQSMLHVNCDMKMRWETDILQMRPVDGPPTSDISQESDLGTAAESPKDLVDSPTNASFEPLTADEEWEDDAALLRTIVEKEGGNIGFPVALKSQVGNELCHTNPARFPNREAIRSFFAQAIAKGVVVETGEGGTKLLSLPTGSRIGNGEWLPLAQQSPVSRAEMPARANEMSRILPFIIFSSKQLCPSGTIFPKRTFTQFTDKWVILLFASLLDAQRTVNELPWLRAGTLVDWRKVEAEYNEVNDLTECSRCGASIPTQALNAGSCPDCVGWDRLEDGKKAEAVERVVAMLEMMAENDDVYIAENILSKQLGLRYPDDCSSRKLGSLWIKEAVSRKEAVSFKRPGVKSKKLICLPEQCENATAPFPPDDMDTSNEEEHVEKILWETEGFVSRKQIIESLKRNFERMNNPLMRSKVFINGHAKNRYFVAKGVSGQAVGLTTEQALAALKSRGDFFVELQDNVQRDSTAGNNSLSDDDIDSEDDHSLEAILIRKVPKEAEKAKEAENPNSSERPDAAESANGLVDSPTNAPFKPLTADEEWEDDAAFLRAVIQKEGGNSGSPFARKSQVGIVLRQTNPARFPDRKALRSFLALAIEKGVVVESGEGPTKLLSLPTGSRSGSGKGPSLPQQSPVSRAQIPTGANEMSHITGDAPRTLHKKSYQYVFNAILDENGNRASRNLHVTGYGSSTTPKQIDKIFSEYAFVVEVIPKCNNFFMFVHTADRDQAILARQRLTGYQVNGGALKINFAKC